MISSPEIHIFNDSEDFFKIKHDLFIEEYLGQCLMGGESLNFSPLEDIVFIHHDNFEKVFCSRVLNGIINSNSLIRISNYSLINSNLNLDIFYLNNYEDIEDFYCVSQSFDFLVEGEMLTQIYEVKIKSLDMINDFWLTSQADIAEW